MSYWDCFEVLKILFHFQFKTPVVYFNQMHLQALACVLYFVDDVDIDIDVAILLMNVVITMPEFCYRRCTLAREIYRDCCFGYFEVQLELSMLGCSLSLANTNRSQEWQFVM